MDERRFVLYALPFSSILVEPSYAYEELFSLSDMRGNTIAKNRRNCVLVVI